METEEEKEFWNRAKLWEETKEIYKVCQHTMDEAEIPKSMGKWFCKCVY